MKKQKINMMKLKILIGAFSIGAVFSEFIEDVLNARWQFLSILFIVGIDLFFGIVKALKNDEFRTTKALVGVYRLVSFWALLAVVLTIERGFSFASFLSEAILLPIIIFQLISALKSMQVLGIISGDMITSILKRIDHHKEVKSEV